jgi:hypothetical protein
MSRSNNSLQANDRSWGDLLRAHNGVLAKAHPVWFWSRACVQGCGMWALVDAVSRATPWRDANLLPQARLDLALVALLGVVFGTIEWAQARNRGAGEEATTDSRAV